MKTKFLMIILASAIYYLPTFGSAQEIYDYRSSAPEPGTRFMIEVSNGKTGWFEYISQNRFKIRDGKIRKTNEDGNTLRHGSTHFKPHSGFRPTGSKGALSVGMSWRQDYEKDGVQRVRKCEVVENRDYQNGSIIVVGAFLVECENKRSGRQLPMYEKIWFAPNLAAEIAYDSKWYGNNPGGFWYKVMKISNN